MIIISGSLAYDRIMDFPGYFKDHIIPEKVHAISLSFAVKDLKEQFGGTSGNIAYNLAQLGEKPIIWAAAGNDFAPYKKWLKKHSVDTHNIKEVKNQKTASAYMITDKADNQIVGFVFGAINVPMPVPPANMCKKSSLAIVASENIQNMDRLVRTYKKNKLPYIYDPSQQIPILSGAQLRRGISGAHVLIGNDYEISMIYKKIKWSKNEIMKKVNILIETFGENGSVMWGMGKKYRIPPAVPKKVVDPTGAGDAYRAGLIYGLLKNWPLEKVGRFAGVTAVYAVEKYGAQNHQFTLNKLEKRYKREFGEEMCVNSY